MLLFNSIQTVVIYSLWPFLCMWLRSQTFHGSSIALLVCTLLYIPFTIFMVMLAYTGYEKMK